MKRTTVFLMIVLLSLACGPSEPTVQLSRTPASVRGWIQEIEPPETELYRLRSATTGAAQARTELFQETSVTVENFQFASGGVAETGAFMVLDVPPGSATLVFTVSHLGDLKLQLQNVPPNADILLPALKLSKSGVSFVDPKHIVVRVPKGKSSGTAAPAVIQGTRVPVREVSLTDLEDRRDYPVPVRIE